ncbi:hypothetical protein [Fortiea contorta]|uniref:hypothetical protein n=1 Tax=Fortiea contorta TaxID=1892405 RepID=UPI0003457A0C|nr:hypothetical protein [Fortiea contorta]
MGKWLRKGTPKNSKLHQSAGAIAPVSQTPQPQNHRGNWLFSTVAIAILLGSAGSIVFIAWLSILFIFHPEQIGWVNKMLPEWAQIPIDNSQKPQTLPQIQLSLSQQKQIPGEILPLENNGDNSFLLPVFQERSPCESDCRMLVELRLYQRATDLVSPSPTEKFYHLVTQLPVTGPDESFVLADDEDSQTSTALPLTTVQRFEGKTPASGVWFYLSHQLPQDTGAIAYGNIVYYNRERRQLQPLLFWKSLSGQLPKWQQITGNSIKELVIDQTVGFEPQLQIYQAKAVKSYLNPIQLEEISLKSPAIKDSVYENALFLAENGLWTPAFEWLKSLQKQRQQVFSSTAQAQLDLIRFHSQLTKIQADKIWASPGQQVLADLIDGRWQKALQVWEASPQNVSEITSILKADQGRLWKRTQAALRVNPNRVEVQAWATLILAVQKPEGEANAWLQSQPNLTPDTLSYIQGLLARLDNQVAKSQISSSHPSRIIGTVQAISLKQECDKEDQKLIQPPCDHPKWFKSHPEAELKLAEDEIWYQIEVSAFNDGDRWLNYPFTNLHPPKNTSGKFFWEVLGINADPVMQIVTWLPHGEQQTTTGTIKAVQFQAGVLRLLASGAAIPGYKNDTFPSRPLGLTNAALEWVQPSAIALKELAQQNPQLVKVILPKVWQSLQQSGEIPASAVPDWQQMQQQMSDWPVQVIDLTNNSQPEIVLTISAEAIASLTQTTLSLSRPRTLILSENGNILYTDFQPNSQQALTAIAKLANDQSLTLLVETANNYSLQRWSERNQRFE